MPSSAERPPACPRIQVIEFLDVVEQLGGRAQPMPLEALIRRSTTLGSRADYATTKSEGNPPQPADVGKILECFDTAKQLPVIYQLATEFAVCDHWFSSLPGPTWPNRSSCTVLLRPGWITVPPRER